MLCKLFLLPVPLCGLFGRTVMHLDMFRACCRLGTRFSVGNLSFSDVVLFMGIWIVLFAQYFHLLSSGCSWKFRTV